MAQRKECSTCKHKKKTAKQKPCLGCWRHNISTFTNWESETTTPPDELDKEAKDDKEEVVSIIASALYNIRNTSGHPLMDTGKCDEIAEFIYSDLINEFTLKQKIEAL